MYRRFLIAAVLVTSIPLATAGAAEQRDDDYWSKKICKVEKETGSRLGGVKRCRTRGEWDALKRETQTQIDRVQAMKVTCPTPNGRCG